MINIKTKEIYLAGGVSGLSFDEANQYRQDIKVALMSMNGDHIYSCNVCNPMDYYNFESQYHETEKEIMRFDLDRVRNSDLIVVNFNSPKSLGTMSELAIAYDRHIPIIGLNECGDILHPWQEEMCNRIFTDTEELIEHIINYYLN